ncbi:DUF4132 domain-containing protein [Kitasatospora sp. NPDC085895]|uniref:DUF4132 domain-containing protein n=1 Tax=Kitasatospora sp. NPDC085895 TaxID=3155057 RepID=UPI00344D1CBD
MDERVDELLDPENAWVQRIRVRLAALSPELTELVLHLAASGEFWDWRGKTNGVWKRRTKALLKADGAPELVREAVMALAEGGSLHNRTDPNTDYGWLRPSPTRHLANGFALACGLLGGKGADPASTDALVEVLLTVARKNASVLDGYFVRDDDLSGAVFTALGDLAAMDALWTLHREVQPGAHCHLVLVRVVKKTATRLGLLPEQLAERTVPTCGLDPDRTVRLGPPACGAPWVNLSYQSVVTLESSGEVTVDWIHSDGSDVRTRSPFRSPKGFKARHGDEQVHMTRWLARHVESTLSAERSRLRAMLPLDRTWPYAEWARHYRDHPVTGLLTRTLIWEHRNPDGTWTAGLPAADHGLHTPAGPSAGAHDDTLVRLWRADRAPATQQQALAELLESRGVEPLVPQFAGC